MSGRLAGWLVLVSVLIASNWAARLTSSPPEANAAYDWNVAAGSTIEFLFVLGIIKGFKAAALLIVTENSVDESQNIMVSSKSIVNQVDLAGRIILDTLTTESA